MNDEAMTPSCSRARDIQHPRRMTSVRFRAASQVALVLGCLAAALYPGAARADDKPPSAERLKSAAEEYDKGRRAYLANDFEQAAVHFENAYNDAPRAEALRNAIRARSQAKQLSRAATLSALAASLYSSDAATMDLATATLKDARSKLHEVSIACTPECGVAADGRVVSLVDVKSFTLFLDPGPHDVVVSWPQDRSQTSHVEAKAQGKDNLALTAPPVPPPPPPNANGTQPTGTTGPIRPPPPPPPPEPQKPLGRVPFFIGAGLTVVGIGATVFSGIDAQNNPGVSAVKRDCVGLGESCPTYQKGRDAQFRTNVILGVTGGVALATAVIGVFFTQWSQPAQGRVGLIPYVVVPGGSGGAGGAGGGWGGGGGGGGAAVSGSF